LADLALADLVLADLVLAKSGKPLLTRAAVKKIADLPA
jgi:hypothetical protein